jgi:hypothetical protein
VKDLAPFKRKVRDEKTYVALKLAEGSFVPVLLWRRRFAIAIMETHLKNSPNFVLSFAEDKFAPGRPEDRWHQFALERAEEAIDPKKRDKVKFDQRMREYEARAIGMTLKVLEPYQRRTNYEVVTIRENQLTKKVVAAIGLALMDSARFHRYDFDFLNTTVDQALERLLHSERVDLWVALRLAATLPIDATTMPLPQKEQRPLYVLAIETAISFIPFVGNLVAAYEAYSGKDLFGYQLTDAERAVMALAVIVPIAVRCIKHEKAIYSATRLSRLYGGTPAEWSHALAVGENLSSIRGPLQEVQSAIRTTAAGQRLTSQAAVRMGDLLEQIGIAKGATNVPVVLSQRAVNAYNELVSQFPRWVELDANAIQRIADLRVQSKIKGHLLEELTGNRFALWLNDPAGKAALGLDVAGKVEFIPGHLIRARSGMQRMVKGKPVLQSTFTELTDGILVVPTGENEYQVAAVLEAKAGQWSARGLTVKKGEKLTQAERIELRAYAEELFKDAQDIAATTGEPVNTSVGQIMKELLDAPPHIGGQLRSDIERLSELQVFFGGVPVKLDFSPNKTKFFGILPADVNPSRIAVNGPEGFINLFEEAKQAGIKNFEVIGFGVTSKELDEAARVLAQMLR